MDIQLPADQERIVQDKVDAGRNHDQDDVIREALQALNERERLHDLRVSLLGAKAHVDNGNFIEWSPTFMDDLTREADELAAQGYRPKPDVCP